MVTLNAIIKTPEYLSGEWSIILFLFFMWVLTIILLSSRIAENKELKATIKRLNRKLNKLLRK